LDWGRERGGLYHLILHDLEGFCDSSVPVLVSPFAQRKPHFNAIVSNFVDSNSVILHFVKYVDVSANVWHSRLGRLFDSIIQVLHNVLPSYSSISNKDCLVCPLAKQHRIPFPTSITHSNCSFDLVHCDIYGPFSSLSSNGSKFFLTIVDDHSRFTWVYLMHIVCPKPESSSSLFFI
jgi:hypothetical protein